jgi:site-specific DNA-cytosine methylase
MENVPEMESYHGGVYHADFLDGLEELGYTSKHWTVDAAAYGVPQHRNRLVYLVLQRDFKARPLR